MLSREELIKLSNPADSELTDEQYMAKRSVLARGFPYYGKLRSRFPDHFGSFGAMHTRCRDCGIETEFPRTVEGFIDFILYLGDVPEGMSDSSLGRSDHDKGYVRGNFAWQSRSDNSAEVGSCSGYLNLSYENAENVKKKRSLESFIESNTGKFHLVKVKELTGRTNGRRILEHLQLNAKCKIVDYKHKEDFSVVLT